MFKVVYEPLVLVFILVGLVLWGLSLVSNVPDSWWTGWSVGIAISLVLGIYHIRRRASR